MDKLNDIERNIVSKILAHVEKNCTNVYQVEDYLYRLIDNGTEFENHKTIEQLDLPVSLYVDLKRAGFNDANEIVEREKVDVSKCLRKEQHIIDLERTLNKNGYYFK